MARIPDVEIERLKKTIPIEHLVAPFGIELKRHGANLVGRCPFHDDRTPSLIVTPATNLWACKGKCNIGGSTIDWIMKTQGVSFRHAAELLRAEHPSLPCGRKFRACYTGAGKGTSLSENGNGFVSQFATSPQRQRAYSQSVAPAIPKHRTGPRLHKPRVSRGLPGLLAIPSPYGTHFGTGESAQRRRHRRH